MIRLLQRDIRLAIRSGGGFGLALAFFLMVVVLVPFGVGPEREVLSKIAPGILWVGALLACLLSLDRVFAKNPTWLAGSLFPSGQGGGSQNAMPRPGPFGGFAGAFHPVVSLGLGSHLPSDHHQIRRGAGSAPGVVGLETAGQ